MEPIKQDLYLVLFHVAVQGRCNLKVYERNPSVWSFKWQVLTSTGLDEVPLLLYYKR